MLPNKLKNIVFLGTSHRGAPLETVGNWIDTMLGRNWVTKPFAAIGQIRSSGIIDLRYGHVLESSWPSKDRFVRSPDSREPLPLPVGVNCFTAGATTLSQAGALGLHDEALHCLNFEPDNQWTAYGANQMALPSRPGVCAQMLQ